EEIAPRRPIAADVLLGAERIAGAQVLKQADVLMLHHLLPDEVARGSLLPNLDFYEPRTAHGSSLSPAVHASLLARAGRYRSALAALRVAARLDLDDLTASTAGGVHLATMGGVWQALAFGFAGVRPAGDRLRVEPRLPPEWNALQIALRFHGTPLQLRIERQGVSVTPSRWTVERADEHWEVTATWTRSSRRSTTASPGRRSSRPRRRWLSCSRPRSKPCTCPRTAIAARAAQPKRPASRCGPCPARSSRRWSKPARHPTSSPSWSARAEPRLDVARSGGRPRLSRPHFANRSWSSRPTQPWQGHSGASSFPSKARSRPRCHPPGSPKLRPAGR